MYHMYTFLASKVDTCKTIRQQWTAFLKSDYIKNNKDTRATKLGSVHLPDILLYTKLPYQI
jgi:hypothetical protein